MSLSHNNLAFEVNNELLRQLRAAQATWLGPVNTLTTTTGFWSGFAEWPRPDGMFEDVSTQTTLAIEFKPPGHQKSEYVRGLGQAVTYLRAFDYVAIVLPKHSSDQFAIAQYLADTLNEPFASLLPISIFSYEQGVSDLTILKNLILRQVKPPQNVIGSKRTVFWAYWRDLSNYDLLDIIIRMDAGQVGYEDAFQWFWDNKLSTGQAHTWEGNLRQSSPNSSLNAQKANTLYSLRHIGLVDQSLHLTEAGFRLSRLGRLYGATSVAFMQELGRMILIEGRHLELIFWVEKNQRAMIQANKSSSKTFAKHLNIDLVTSGIISTVPTGPKGSFLRDELKLWNKLGLFGTASSGRYFVNGQGLHFDWRVIVSMVS